MKYKNCDFNKAVKWLKGDNYFINSNPFVNKNFAKKAKKYLKPNSDIYKHFHSLCIKNNHEVYQFYGKEKKIKNEIIDKADIRLLDNVKLIERELLQKWGIQKLIDCGIYTEKVNRNTGELFFSLYWYEPFTAIIPFFNEKNNITFLKGRKLKDNKIHLNLKGVKSDIYNRRILKGNE
jgi:hypothetical protein